MLHGLSGKMSNFDNFYQGKKVLVTGHTGFKGSWMSMILNELDATVIGYALDPKNEDLFEQAELSEYVTDIRGDILDKTHLEKVFADFRPEVVFHYAAQPLVINSYNNPFYTWEVNLIGTLNLLEVIRNCSATKSVVIVTTDKVYANQEHVEGYVENDPLGGHDPYSASKSAVELLVQSYRKSFFNNSLTGIRIVTVRAGNVLGGGDWGENRLVPDFYRAVNAQIDLVIRNPNSKRPWQHVLDVNCAYLHVAKKIYESQIDDFESFNVSNMSAKNISSENIIEYLNTSNKVLVKHVPSDQYKETNSLYLNSEKLFNLLGWRNRISFDECILLVKEFYEYPKDRIYEILMRQIRIYLNDCFN